MLTLAEVLSEHLGGTIEFWTHEAEQELRTEALIQNRGTVGRKVKHEDLDGAGLGSLVAIAKLTRLSDARKRHVASASHGLLRHVAVRCEDIGIDRVYGRQDVKKHDFVLRSVIAHPMHPLSAVAETTHGQALTRLISDIEALRNGDELLEYLGADASLVAERDMITIKIGTEFRGEFVAVGAKIRRDANNHIEWSSVHRVKLLEISRVYST